MSTVSLLPTLAAHGSELDTSKVALKAWDKGVFLAELIKQGILLTPSPSGATTTVPAPSKVLPPSSISVGTVEGTKAALTEAFQLVERRFESYLDVMNFESALPVKMSFRTKQDLYTWAADDKYPPHLNIIPVNDQVDATKIFDRMGLDSTYMIIHNILPKDIAQPYDGKTLSALQQDDVQLRASNQDIFTVDNVGLRTDWYTDAVFGQQQFTGVNPMTIEMATSDWITKFTAEATKQGNTNMVALLGAAAGLSQLYMQDCSYFRAAIGVSSSASLASDDGTRFACAPVSIFHLTPEGKLHPLAIIIDYRGGMDQSVTLFNRRLSPSDPNSTEETDWPWRYAKTCSQSADWIRHELAVHLTHTHYMEEATIVATHRSFPPDHPVFALLSPHWLKTLSLNASARMVLVPGVVVPVVGLTEQQTLNFCLDAYKRFDWQANYVPADLTRRGFEFKDPAKAKKLHNYPYAANMLAMWKILRRFVEASLKETNRYASDAAVASDPAIALWCKEMQSPTGGQKTSFPTITTLDQLIDAITMCIHIASPQHTAVNYLQEYYQVFVPNKPSALFSALPTTLTQLQSFKEQDIMNALPLKDSQRRAWLLGTHMAHLLSFRVAEDQNLMNFALSASKLAHQAAGTTGSAAPQNAADRLVHDLVKATEFFAANSDKLDDKTVKYSVMDPVATAVSILI